MRVRGLICRLYAKSILHMKKNIVHHRNFLDNDLPDKCASLIIADPPYFEVKGDFDFIWESRDEYLADVERWARECKRILADNGTLFWWGMDRKIAYSQIVIDKFFTLLNTLVWDRPGLRSGWDTRRAFPNSGMERLLMYCNEGEPEEWTQTGWERVKPGVANFQPMRDYFRQLQELIGETNKAIVDRIGQRADHCFRWSSTQWDMPTAETYEDILSAYSLREHGYPVREYEDLRREYEDLRRPFNNYMKLTDVLKFSQDVNACAKYGHPTMKPMRLASALITTCSRPGDLVVVPFAGSGTECAAAAKEGREFIGYEIDAQWVEIANARAGEYLSSPKLFHAY